MDFDPVGALIGICFSGIGMVALAYGRKMDSPRHIILGVLLVAYSWLVDDPLLSTALGAALTTFLFWPK